MALIRKIRKHACMYLLSCCRATKQALLFVVLEPLVGLYHLSDRNSSCVFLFEKHFPSGQPTSCRAAVCHSLVLGIAQPSDPREYALDQVEPG